MNENRENGLDNDGVPVAADALDVAGARVRAAALILDRGRGWVRIERWGPKCAGCGGDEFRIDGYCSCECRDWHSDDEAVAVARDLVEALAVIADRDRRIAALREVFRDE